MPSETMSPECEKVERDQSVPRKIVRYTDFDMVSRRNALGSKGQLNTSTPCAACKLLRRRCAQECPFSPYFSPHEPQKFASVHKVFGASNVSKMLMEVPESQRADVANSLVYEANARLRDPVHGCMGTISALQQQVQALQAELNHVRAETMRFKYQEMVSAMPVLTAAGASHIGNVPKASLLDQKTTPRVASNSMAFTQYSAGFRPSTVVAVDTTKECVWSVLNQSCC